MEWGGQGAVLGLTLHFTLLKAEGQAARKMQLEKDQ
jgi:hypothetical protein